MDNKYNNPTNFVSPHPQPVRPPDIIMPGMASSLTVDGALTPVESRQGRDSTSARDRAKARLIDSAPLYVAITVLSLAGTVAYILIGDAGFLDSLFLFLVTMGLGLIISDFQRVKLWLGHSHAGVERHRLDTAAAMYKAQLEAAAQVRRDALELQLRMLEDNDQRRLTDGRKYRS